MLIGVIVHSAPPEDLNYLVPILRESRRRLRGVTLEALDRVATRTIDQTEIYRPTRLLSPRILAKLRSV